MCMSCHSVCIIHVSCTSSASPTSSLHDYNISLLSFILTLVYLLVWNVSFSTHHPGMACPNISVTMDKISNGSGLLESVLMAAVRGRRMAGFPRALPHPPHWVLGTPRRVLRFHSNPRFAFADPAPLQVPPASNHMPDRSTPWHR